MGQVQRLDEEDDPRCGVDLEVKNFRLPSFFTTSANVIRIR
jgi:hypothetical protein